MGATLGSPGDDSGHDVGVGTMSGAFPPLRPEFVERFFEGIADFSHNFEAFLRFLRSVHDGEVLANGIKAAADDISPRWNNLETAREQFCLKIDQSCRDSQHSAFSAFVRFCFHEITNLVAPLVAAADQLDALGAIFDQNFESNCRHIQHYFDLLKQGLPPLEQLNLADTVSDLARQHHLNFSHTDEYDNSTKVRIAPATLSAILDNLQRGANQSNGGGAKIHLVLDSGHDAKGRPWVHLNFLSDVHTTALTPERFKQLLATRPRSGQKGGHGLYLSELLLQAQRGSTNVFSSQLPSGTSRTPPCLQFRQAWSSAPLSERDKQIIHDLALPTNFLFIIDLTGMRVPTVEEQFDRAFDQTLVKLADDDVALHRLLGDVRGDIFAVVFKDKSLEPLLSEIPVDDPRTRNALERLVGTIRQCLLQVAA